MNAPLHPEGCLSDLALDRVVATRDHGAGAAHLLACERCRSRLRLFEASSDGAVARAALDALPSVPAPHGSLRFLRLPAALAAAGAAAAAIAFFAVRPAPTPPGDEVRGKGTSLAFFRQRAGAVTHGISGDDFLPGDALRFVVSSGSPGYFFLVGVEPSGEVVAYHPYGGSKSVPLAGGEITLPGSLVLDDSKGTEYFGGLFSREPLALDQIRAAVQKALERGAPPSQGLELPATQHWVVVRKPR